MSGRKFKNREDELYFAASSALMALWNISAVLGLASDTGAFQSAKFPEDIAGAIRIAEKEARSTAARVAPLV